jgi:hypothetical protein
MLAVVSRSLTALVGVVATLASPCVAGAAISVLFSASGRRLADPPWPGTSFLPTGRLANLELAADASRGRVVTGRIGSRSLRPLSRWVPGAGDFAVASDGRRIAVTAQDPHTFEHWIWRADRGRAPRRLTLGAGADWAPNGRRLAFQTRDGLWTADPDGRRRRALARLPEGAFLSGPAWSPDGQQVASIGRLAPTDATELRLFRSRRGGHKVVDLPDWLVSLGPPSWQPRPE